MGTSLSGLLPQDTYQGLLKFGDNSAISASLKAVSDGAGNDSLLYLSTSAIAFGASSNFYWDNPNSRLGLGTSNPSELLHIYNTALADIYTKIQTTQSRTAGVITQNSTANWFNGTQYSASNAYQIFDQQNNRLQLTLFNDGNSQFATSNTSLGAKLGIKGSGSTSATTSLLVQNSGSVANATFRDNGEVSLILDRTGKGLELIDNLALTQSSRYYQRGGVAQVTTSQSVLNYFCWSNNDQGYPNGVFAYDSGRFIISDTQKDLASAGQASAVLQADSTTKGFLPPRMTTTQKNAISSPATGLQVFDTTMNATCEYTGTAWRVVSAGSQALAAPTASTSVDLSAGNVVNLSLTSSTTLTFTGAAIGTYIMRIIQGGSGSYTITWPASVIWSGGTAPTLTTTVAKSDIVTLIYDGTNYYGNYSLNY